MITQFRTAVYRSFTRRADAGLDLIDALTGELHTESPVAVSASPLFRRKFSSIYDVLAEPFIAEAQLRQVLDECQPDAAERIAGDEVYGLDCTPDPMPEAETVPDRSQSKKGKYAPTTVEHRYSWLARLVQEHTSWCMPQDVRRVATSTTDSQVGAAQVQDLAERNLRPKVVVADSLYCNRIFLACRKPSMPWSVCAAAWSCGRRRRPSRGPSSSCLTQTGHLIRWPRPPSWGSGYC